MRDVPTPSSGHQRGLPEKKDMAVEHGMNDVTERHTGHPWRTQADTAMNKLSA